MTVGYVQVLCVLFLLIWPHGVRPGGKSIIEPLRMPSGKPVTDHLYRIRLPSTLRRALLDLVGTTGILAEFQKVVQNPGEMEHSHRVKFNGEEWSVQRPPAHWNSNMHWISPAENAAQDTYLEALKRGGFDQVLDSIGQYFKMDGITAYHLTFIGVSECTHGYDHYDFINTDAKAYNLIIPLQLIPNSSPELDVWCDETEEWYNYQYEYDVGIMIGDLAAHATAEIKYEGETTTPMRVAATVYLADINENNVDGIKNLG